MWDRLQSQPWIETALAALLTLLVVTIALRIASIAARRWANPDTLLGAVVRRGEAPASLAMPLLALQLVWGLAPENLRLIGLVEHLNSLGLIAALTWLGVVSIDASADSILRKHPSDGEDNLRARGVQTQTRVLSRMLIFLVGLLGVSIALMTFPGVRHIGTSLLASAGVAGLVLGLAAKPVLGNLLAGLQIALTQPIRIDDVLVVEGEWGRVEEIRSSYVVVHIWDERRLVLPLQYFIEKPFQNWTRQSARLLGTVMLWVDYRMPIEPLRAEARRICEHDKDWDGRVCIIQVTDTSESAIQLRVLLSSLDSSRNFDLRCRVREALIALIQREYAEFLPRLRAELSGNATLAAAIQPK